MPDINEARVYDISKEYTNMWRVTSYKYGFDPNSLKTNTKNKKQKIKIKNSTENSLQRSVRRSRTMISDYVRCNTFDLFVTFTFSPKKVDRYDLLGTYLKMQTWLHRQSARYSDFKYVIVPERHKDGAIHFHALIGGFDGQLKKTNVIQNNKRVYNITGFRFGFTNAQYLDDDLGKTTAYLCKYITKDMELISNRRRYWCSKNLVKPVSYYNRVFDFGLSHLLTEKAVVYETEYNTIYEFPKPSFD